MNPEAKLDQVLKFLLETLNELKNSDEIAADVIIDRGVPLIGDGGVIDSRTLVELLVALEGFIDEQYAAEFDWTSDRALSGTRSPFRTADTLAEFAIIASGL